MTNPKSIFFILLSFILQYPIAPIVSGIKRFEPRVEIKNVNVNINYEQHEYTIQLVMSVPALNINDKTYDAILAQPGFNFLTNTPTS